MVIAIIDRKDEADRCEAVVRALLPRVTCLITPTVRDIWRSDDPVPALSGVLANGAPDELPPEEREILDEMAVRFPLSYVGRSDDRLREWAGRCAGFAPQRARQPDRLPWETPVVVSAPSGRGPRMCSTGNVSLGGVFIEDPRSKPVVGDRVILRFPALGPQAEAAAEVRWVQAKNGPARAAGFGCELAEGDRWVAAVLVNAARCAGADGGRKAAPA